MKLATALSERADVQRRLSQLHTRLNNNAKVQEGDEPAEDPKALLKELDALLPSSERPEHTEDHEGFFHLTDMKGTVEKAELHYIVRDHDAASFAARQKTLWQIEKFINEKYGAGTVKLDKSLSVHHRLEGLSVCERKRHGGLH